MIKKTDFKLFFIAVLVGLLVEPTAIRFGLWNYPGTSNFLMVPYWIFLIWGVFAVLFYRLGVSMSKKLI